MAPTEVLAFTDFSSRMEASRCQDETRPASVSSCRPEPATYAAGQSTERKAATLSPPFKNHRETLIQPLAAELWSALYTESFVQVMQTHKQSPPGPNEALLTPRGLPGRRCDT